MTTLLFMLALIAIAVSWAGGYWLGRATARSERHIVGVVDTKLFRCLCKKFAKTLTTDQLERLFLFFLDELKSRADAPELYRKHSTAGQRENGNPQAEPVHGSPSAAECTAAPLPAQGGDSRR